MSSLEIPYHSLGVRLVASTYSPHRQASPPRTSCFCCWEPTLKSLHRCKLSDCDLRLVYRGSSGLSFCRCPRATLPSRRPLGPGRCSRQGCFILTLALRRTRRFPARVVWGYWFISWFCHWKLFPRWTVCQGIEVGILGTGTPPLISISW